MTLQKHKILTYFILAFLLFSLGQIANLVFDKDYIQKEDINTVQYIISQKQLSLEKSLNTLSKIDIQNDSAAWGVMDSLMTTDLIYYFYRDSNAVAWSSARIPLGDYYPELNTVTLEKFPNGWYLVNSKKVDNYLWLVLSLIKEEYSYQNKFLSNSFVNDKNLNYHPHITLDKQTDSSFHIKDNNGNFLFAVQFDQFDKHVPKISILIFLVNILAIILLLIAGNRLIVKYSYLRKRNYLFLGAIIYFFLIYIIFTQWSIPDAFYHTAVRVLYSRRRRS